MTKQVQGRFRAVTSSPQDLAQLEAIMRETFTDTFASEQSAEDLNAFLDKNYNQPVLKRELADQDSETFFYEVDGQPAGTQLRLKSNLRTHWKFSGFTSGSNFKNCTSVAS